MQHGRCSRTADHSWGDTGAADGDSAMDRHAERMVSGLSRRASYEPQPLRERLKPILDELRDTLEYFEGEPTPEDYRWLRGQLRRLANHLDPRTG